MQDFAVRLYAEKMAALSLLLSLRADNLGFPIISTTLMSVLAAALFPGIQVMVINKINACVLDVALCMGRFYEPKKIIIIKELSEST